MPVSLPRLCNQVGEKVDLIVGVDVLQNGRQPLQAHAGIDAWCRQRAQRAVGRPIELHEHQIPDFDETVAIFLR